MSAPREDFQPTLSAGWRTVAVVLSLAWLGSLVALIVVAFGGYANRFTGIAGILVMLASLIVLALLRNLGKIVAGTFDAPGPWEVRLAVAGGAMLIAAWLLHLSA